MDCKKRFSGNFISVIGFITFLYDHRYLDRFMANALTSSEDDDPWHFLTALFRSNPRYYIGGAFSWHRTPEGYDFWLSVNALWEKYRKKHRIS